VPIVGGDFEERALAAALDHVALNQAAASLYRDRFGSTPGIVYAAGVDHAYNLAQEFRAAGLQTMAVSGRTPPRELAETLAAYERGEINVLINAQLLAEGWNSPRATVCMHLAPTASKRVCVVTGSHLIVSFSFILSWLSMELATRLHRSMEKPAISLLSSMKEKGVASTR